MTFIDEVTITVKAGAGGKGCESFRGRTDRKRIPDGGDGGDGGDVILRADPQTGSLFYLKSKHIFEAEPGGAGGRANSYGRKGKDMIVKVPCGTTVYNKRDELLIRDLVVPNDEVTVLKGGRGGYGNHAERPTIIGESSKELELMLSFKIIADIFLVGLPNSGKTTFLRKLTGAGVSETEYPFATKAPQLGTYRDRYKEYSICELPAIYKSSDEGRGLGTHFLKHLERAKLIFLMLEPQSDFAENLKSGLNILRETIKNYNPEFLKIPSFVVVNKSDLIPKSKLASLKKSFPAREKVFFISAKEETGFDRLMKAAVKQLETSYETANQ